MEATLPVWLEAVGTVGFPIVMVLALCFFIWTIYKDNKAEKQKLMEINEKAINTLDMYANRLSIIEEDVKIIKDDISVIAHGGK